MRTTFINTLIELAKKDDRIFLITPDMGYSVLEKYRGFPEDQVFAELRPCLPFERDRF